MSQTITDERTINNTSTCMNALCTWNHNVETNCT